MSRTLKEKALKIAEARNLCSYMNDTKWNELRLAVLNDLPFPPPYIMKTLFKESCPDEKSFQHDVSYLGDWYEGLIYQHYFNGGFAIEWIKVRRYNIPFSFENEMYCIYGYK